MSKGQGKEKWREDRLKGRRRKLMGSRGKWKCSVRLVIYIKEIQIKYNRISLK